MAKTYLDILTKRGIDLFLSEENLESLRKFDPRAEYAVPARRRRCSVPPSSIGRGGEKLQPDCRYVLVRAVRHGMVILDADKHHLDWKRSVEEHGIPELYQKYRRFHRKPGLTEREKLVITAYTGYVLEGTAGKVVDFVEEVLGHSIQTPGAA